MIDWKQVADWAWFLFASAVIIATILWIGGVIR